MGSQLNSGGRYRGFTGSDILSNDFCSLRQPFSCRRGLAMPLVWFHRFSAKFEFMSQCPRLNRCFVPFILVSSDRTGLHFMPCLSLSLALSLALSPKFRPVFHLFGSSYSWPLSAADADDFVLSAVVFHGILFLATSCVRRCTRFFCLLIFCVESSRLTRSTIYEGILFIVRSSASLIDTLTYYLISKSSDSMKFRRYGSCPISNGSSNFMRFILCWPDRNFFRIPLFVCLFFFWPGCPST